ncbi:DUF4900 domain-containing protein [bacterium]|nr:DUF4900 domain-containing protein [bacterium]
MRHLKARTLRRSTPVVERKSAPPGGRGSALVGVMAITTVVLLVGVAIFTLGNSESDIVEYAVDDARAFYVAEGGLERVRAWLGDLMESDPSANPVGMVFEDQALGGGRYTVQVVDDPSIGSWLVAYEVVCTAEVDDATRRIRTIMVPETFAKYQWFAEGGGWRWFCTGERFEGRVHVRDNLLIDGDPWFGGRVTVGGGLTMEEGSGPTFVEGYELNVGVIPLPGVADIDAGVKTAALNGGLHAGMLPKVKDFYHVALGSPSPGELTYEGRRPQGPGYLSIDGPHIVNISSLNGAAWFEEPVAVEGILDGQLTIYADGDIQIWDDILYDASTPGAGPDPECDDVLGLIAGGDIEISYTVPNQSDCEIHGVMIALGTNVQAERYTKYDPRGSLIIYGGVIAQESVRCGQFQNGYCVHGYERDYRVDPRLTRMPPPFFPVIGRYLVYSWEEIDPPEA